MRSLRRLPLHGATASLVACAFALASPALAQDSSALRAKEVPENEGIIVTARKVSEGIQDVPLTVTALGAEELQKLGAFEVKDVLLTVPGLTYGGAQRGLSTYIIRGISTSATAPTVGLYLDDISLVTLGNGFSGAFDPVFFDMERLEVLKGPQGTLYGGNAMGGAIKYVSAKPSLTKVTGSVAGQLADTRAGEVSAQTEAAVSIPVVSEKLAIRVGGFYALDGGFIDNIPGGTINNPRVSTTPFPTYTPLVQISPSTFDQPDLNRTETYAGRASALFASGGFTLLPAVFYQETHARSQNSFFFDSPGLTSTYRFAQPLTEKAGVYSLTATQDFGGVELTSITAFFNRSLRNRADYSTIVSTFVPPAFGADSFNQTTTRVRTFSQELRLASAPTSDSPLQWLVGLYYSNQRNQVVQDARSTDLAPVFGTDLLFFGDARTRLKQYAGFGEINYRLTDKLELTAGARVFRIEQEYDAVADGVFNGGPTAINRPANEDGFNPKVGLSYRLTEDNLVFASATKGFRPGGPNVFAIDPVLCAVSLEQLGRTAAPETFGSDDLWTYEIGTKNEFADRKALINVSAFYTRWTDIQQNFALNSCGFNFTDNAGVAEITGIEFEGRFEPIGGFIIGANLTYNDAEITSAPVGVSAQTGDRILGTPEWAGNVYADYTAPVSDRWDVNVRVDFAYQGDIRNQFERVLPVTFANGPNFIDNPAEFRDSYSVVNANVILTDGVIQVRAFGNNLGNERPLIDQEYTFSLQRGSTIRPRTFGIAARYNF